MLSIAQGLITFIGAPSREVGTVRYSPSFSLAVEEVSIIGYAPRLVADDESSFLILINKKQDIYYFNLDLIDLEAIRALEYSFDFSLRHHIRNYSSEEYTQGITEIVYPAALRGTPLFKSWSWFSPRGLLKKAGYILGMDRPMWERLTPEVKDFINR